MTARSRSSPATPTPGSTAARRWRSSIVMTRRSRATAKSLAIKKDHADAHFNQALALLTLGDYRRGFAEYEWRWRRTGMARAEEPRQAAMARRISAGAQDRAAACRAGAWRHHPVRALCAALAAAGAKVVLEVQPELKSLMARLDGGATVIARGEAPPAFDVHCPLGSLPLALKTEPAPCRREIPYLSAERRACRQMVGRDRRAAAAAHRARLVRQSRPRQRPQPLAGRSRARAAVAASPAKLHQHSARRARRRCGSACRAKPASRMSATSLRIFPIPPPCSRCAIS